MRPPRWASGGSEKKTYFGVPGTLDAANSDVDFIVEFEVSILLIEFHFC